MKIFIVEDDSFYSAMIQHTLQINPEFTTRAFSCAADFLQCLHEKPDIVTLDFNLPDKNGDEILNEVKQLSPETCVVVVSALDDVKVAIELIKKGADDYLVKDAETPKRLWLTVQKLKDKIELKRELAAVKEQLGRKYSFQNTIIGASAATKELYKYIEVASKSDATLLIKGETGTGKDLIAKSIHYNSKRKNRPFISINVASIPEDALEQELFGSSNGNGSHADVPGRFEQAMDGTVFIDEVTELDASIQARLLKIVQDKVMSRPGSAKVVKIQARVIVATSQNLPEQVKLGLFREDLYYKLLAMNFTVPPLRERGNDVALIASHFVEQFCSENNIPPKLITQEAKLKLLKHPFPGNIRELKSLMELACVMSDEPEIGADHINIDNSGYATPFLFEKAGTLKELTAKIIQYYLDTNQYDVLKVANILDIGKSTIYRMIQNHELVIHQRS